MGWISLVQDQWRVLYNNEISNSMRGRLFLVYEVSISIGIIHLVHYVSRNMRKRTKSMLIVKISPNADLNMQVEIRIQFFSKTKAFILYGTFSTEI